MKATIVVCLMLLLGSDILSTGINGSFRDSNSYMADIPAEVHIAKPKEGYLYIADKEIMCIGITLIIGEITVEAEGDVNSIMFYVDDELRYIDHDEPYEWLWDETVFGKHKLSIEANGIEDEIDVFILNYEREEPPGKEKPDIIPEKYERPEQGWKEPAVLYKHIDLKPHRNVDSRGIVGYLYVGDLNGDGKADFLYNVGLEYVRAFDHAGNLMWEIKSPLAGKVRGLGIRDAYHPKLAAIYDFDNDGQNEVAILVPLRADVKTQMLSIVNGKDGKIEKSVVLPFKGFRGVLAVGYMRGGKTPEIAVTSSDSCSWVAVYDSNLNLLWKKIFPDEKLGHYLWFYDIDDDGKQELFVGKRLFDENGEEIWNMREFVETGDHVDSMTCGDIDPANPGKEVVVCGAIGIACYDKNGDTIWSRIKDPDIKNPQTVMLGEFDKNRQGLEIRVQKKPPGYGKGEYPLATEEWLLDKDGNILFHADLPNWQGGWQIDWDGDRSEDEILLSCGAVAKWRNGNFWILSYGPFGLKEKKPKDPRRTQRPTSYAYEFDAIPMDIVGDPREEIIFYDDDEIIIVKNSIPLKGDIPSFRNETRYKLRYANRDYHTNAPIFFNYQTTPTKKGSKKGFVTVCGNHFCLNGERFRFVGANKASLPAHTHQEIDDTFEEASKLGIKVMRVFVHDPLNIPNYTFEKFDYMLDSAKRHKIRLIITLANNDRDPILYMLRAHPDLGDYEKIRKDREKAEEIRKSFFGDEEANELYRDFVYKMVTRTNSINGIQYKQDSTIFSWELMNEPAYAAPSIDILINWIEKTSSYIRSIDQNHMISIGSEGNWKYYLTNQGENYFVKVHQIATNISFCTFHIYGHAEFSRNDYTKIIEGIIQDAHETLNKPIVMEEYGISKRKCNHTWTREGFYQFMLDEFYSKDGDGTAFWAFSARSDLTEEELERETGISLHPDDAKLRKIIKEKAEEIESDKPDVYIRKPGNCLYIFDKKVISSPIPIIVGRITIKADVFDINGIQKVEFYIDDNLKFVDYESPYDWLWNEFAIGRYEIKVIAYDNEGNKAEDGKNVMIFNLRRG